MQQQQIFLATDIYIGKIITKQILVYSILAIDFNNEEVKNKKIMC